jgi:hypothetical protein
MLLVFSLLPSIGMAQTDEDLVSRLISTPNLGLVYIADGAGDGSVLNTNPTSAVKDILALKEAAIPLLIRHLNDTRLTSARYQGGKYWKSPVEVPAGYICLDILSQIVQDKKQLFVTGHRDCEYDGMGACIRPSYYFRPEDLILMENQHANSNTVITTKKHWEQAYKTGLLKFRLPEWMVERNRTSASSQY